MAGFDPKAYVSGSPSSGFDPKAYISGGNFVKDAGAVDQTPLAQALAMTSDAGPGINYNPQISEGIAKQALPVVAGTLAPELMPAEMAIAEGAPMAMRAAKAAYPAAKAAVGGAAQGFSSAADSVGERFQNAAKDAGLAGLLHLGAASVGAAGDFAMQKAVGVKDYVYGLGKRIADEGIIGTKGIMKDQVKQKLALVGSQMEDAANARPKTYIDTTPIASKVRGYADKLRPLSGEPDKLDVPTINEYMSHGASIESRGMEDLRTAVDRRRIAGKRGFGDVIDEAKRGTVGVASRAEQGAYSKAIKEAAPEFIPLDRSYAALSEAGSGLRDKTDVASLLMPYIARGGAGAVVGYGAGGAKGAAIGATLAASPLTLSTIGQAAVKAEPILNTPAARAALLQMMAKDRASKLQGSQ